jgi:hypothetical protein
MHPQTGNILKEHKAPLQSLSQWFLLLGVLLSAAVIASAALYLDGKRELLISDGVKDARRVNTVPKNQIKPDHGRVANSAPRSVATLRGYTFG